MMATGKTRSEIGPFMVRTGSKLVMADCVSLNRCPKVIAAFREFDIEVFSSAGRGHNVVGGQAPYTHETSAEDGSMFGPFQDDISKIMAALPPVDTHTRSAQMFDEITKLWCSQKYRDMGVKAVDAFGGICRDIREREGAPTHR